MTATHPIAPIRTAIKAAVSGVSGIGMVYDYLRHIETEAEIKAELVKSSRLHFWSVTLANDDKFAEEHIVGGSKAWITFVIHGNYALKDSEASEKTFINLVEDVLDALRVDKTLGGTVMRMGAPKWVGPNHAMVVNVLCHHAEIVVPVLTAVEC